MYRAFCVCAPPLILNTPPLYSLIDTPPSQAQTVNRKVFYPNGLTNSDVLLPRCGDFFLCGVPPVPHND